MVSGVVAITWLAAATPLGAQQTGETFRDRNADGSECVVCPEMVVVPAGSFIMGSPDTEEGRDDDESPQHLVTIDTPFAVGKFEVTFSQWDACVAAGGCNDHSPDDRGFGRGNRPVLNVSWDDATAYVRWLSRKTGKAYRLPSESEWEYMARAGGTSKYPFGDSESSSCEYGNGADRDARFSWKNESCSDGYGEGTAPVGSFKPNNFGVYDTVGNLFEFVEDCWHGGYAGAPKDGSAWTDGGDCSIRVLRGGSWGAAPEKQRSANRYRNSTDIRNNDSGIRVARTLP
jgi:formylglycine-generating enzyme required for sulfatase activity